MATEDVQMPNGTYRCVAFDQNGAAVVADKSHISLYSHISPSSTSSSAPSYSLTGKIPLPSGVGLESNCCKAITNTTLAVQELKDDAPTFLFRRSDLLQLSTLHHPGILRGALGDHLVYAKELSISDCIICVHREGDVEMILEPPAGRTWGSGLSVCGTSGYITVVDSKKSMDVFSVTGEHSSYRKLDYVPRGYSGITAFGHSHVIVAQWCPPALHIYQLPGLEMTGTLSGTELGLGEDVWVNAVQYSDQGIIHLATGNGIGVYTDSLRTYKVTEGTSHEASPNSSLSIEH